MAYSESDCTKYVVDMECVLCCVSLCCEENQLRPEKYLYLELLQVSRSDNKYLHSTPDSGLELSEKII